MKDLLENSDNTMYFLRRVKDLYQFGMDLIEQMFSNSEFQKLLDEKFDLFILEGVGQTDCLLGLGAHFNVPVIMIVSVEPPPSLNEIMGNPNSYSFIPHVMLDYKTPMNFIHRLFNMLFLIIGNILMIFFESNTIAVYK